MAQPSLRASCELAASALFVSSVDMAAAGAISMSFFDYGGLSDLYNSYLPRKY